MTEPQHKILIVEDDPSIALALTVRLEMEGYDVRHAADADAALSEADAFRPDLAILDVSLPGGDGIDVASEIRGRSATAGIPAIVLTASKRPDLRVRAEAAGALFFEKPYDGRELIATVRRLLGPVEAQG